ncbi:MarR family transcriptional regulator [Paenibacillus pectinilyticus]|uniref:MarR family transcriptional regulator n=1 Tax=Paenibacillus pectinilyticus TaxID=512399 RepID=A0A1C0ZTR6_9BACL|nr:MarR family transcriptional regulator [Paenibacillus pectinilyticus]OCT11413.1 MarR family transcriptional regulator [Paenibacillus pectinilyticus]
MTPEQDWLTAKFRELKNVISSYLTHVLPQFHISPITMYVLEYLRKHPDCIAVDIANEFGLTRGAITQLIDKMEAQGLVVRKPHPTSRRSQLLQMTDKGHELINNILAVYNTKIEQLFTSYTKEELAVLQELLAKMPL